MQTLQFKKKDGKWTLDGKRVEFSSIITLLTLFPGKITLVETPRVEISCEPNDLIVQLYLDDFFFNLRHTITEVTVMCRSLDHVVALNSLVSRSTLDYLGIVETQNAVVKTEQSLLMDFYKELDENETRFLAGLCFD